MIEQCEPQHDRQLVLQNQKKLKASQDLQAIAYRREGDEIIGKFPKGIEHNVFKQSLNLEVWHGYLIEFYFLVGKYFCSLFVHTGT